MQLSKRKRTVANLPLKVKKREKRPSRPAKFRTRRRATLLPTPVVFRDSHLANVPQFSRRRRSRKSSDSNGELILGLVGIFLVASTAFWLFAYPLL